MLKSRYLLLVLCLFCAASFADSKSAPKDIPPVSSQAKASNNDKGQPAAKQEITVNFPASTGSVLSGSVNVKSENVKKPTHEEPSKWADPITWFTLVIAIGTLLLWGSTIDLAKEAKASSDIAKIAADAAKDSADSLFVTSMPILFPTVSNMAGLHPLIPIATPYTYDSNIFIQFENFGPTPATIRDIRAKLYLTLNDIPPAPNPSDWLEFSYPVMIPGNSRAADQNFGALDMKQTIAYGKSEITELHREADPEGGYRRFVLMGQVIYDDFLGWRHTRTFCVKLRAWQDGNILKQFQVGMGGSAYNEWTKEKIPNPDPLETTAS